jgi:hypothetical protein
MRLSHPSSCSVIDLELDLEVLLKLDVLRQERPMAEIVREAVKAYQGLTNATATGDPTSIWCPVGVSRPVS